MQEQLRPTKVHNTCPPGHATNHKPWASIGLARGQGRVTENSFTNFKDGLANPWIWTILEDKTGNLKLGTREMGLYLFDGKKFNAYSK